jgi:hypothetical protein
MRNPREPLELPELTRGARTLRIDLPPDLPPRIGIVLSFVPLVCKPSIQENARETLKQTGAVS